MTFIENLVAYKSKIGSDLFIYKFSGGACNPGAARLVRRRNQPHGDYKTQLNWLL